MVGIGGTDAGVGVAGDDGVEGVMGVPDIVWSCPVVGCRFIGGNTWGESKVHIVLLEEFK